MLERAWGARAGLGWIGKNSLLLRRDLGSWFFLGAILTTLEAEADSPAAPHCGSCRACLDACPTNAIVAPKVVDSSLCISYHTIENRGPIPEEIANRMGDWLFGCDICQEVCPWNRQAGQTGDEDFAPRPGQAHVSLARLREMDENEFRGAFEGSPLLRAKHGGLRRNAAIVERNLQRGKTPEA